MVDSVGLNLIVTLLKRVQQRGGRMQIAYSSPNIFRTFTFTRLDKHVELVKVSTSQQPPLPEAPNAAPSPRRDLSA